MANQFLGEIRLVPYTFAPVGWSFCHGQLLPISQNTALFSILGTTYGGNGMTTFALPDFRGRTAMAAGQGPGLTTSFLGDQFGVEGGFITQAQMRPHAHALRVSADGAVTQSPAGAALAVRLSDGSTVANAQPATLAPLRPAGGGQPVPMMQPYLVLNFIIAIQGVYPPRP